MSSSDPIRFVFGVHQHQPVGNFGHVFEEHTREVYFPLLKRLVEREFFPIVMHLSGPLLEWLESSHSKYLDIVGELASSGKIEMLCSGYYEPVLASLPREDRVEQIVWMRESIESRFGVASTGLWLTERVWEPELAADLSNAGVRYVLVDDRHFLVSGFQREQLHVPWRTESDGRRVDVLAIDERLRYLIPFRPPAEIATYLRDLRSAGHRMAVFADDGEKFGGWPGTREWVYGKGWLDDFIATVQKLVASGEVALSTSKDAIRDVPSGGLAYLPTASYREMEGWSLPSTAATGLAKLEAEIGPERLTGPDGVFIRGAHWRNFFVKYPESNRAHKKMMALSALCRRRGDPEEARRAIGRGQCNDAYWHGVFGGLYLPHLREGIWKNLAHAERVLRSGDDLQAETLDFDADGHEEVWVHSPFFSAVVAPARGCAIEEYTIFADGINYADVLTRRTEAYHFAAVAEASRAAQKTSDVIKPAADRDDGVASIHDLEHAMTLVELPPVDLDNRALLVDRLLSEGVTAGQHASADYVPLRSWARVPLKFEVRGDGSSLEIVCSGHALEKRIRFSRDGSIDVDWKWDQSAAQAGANFSTELSLFRPLALETGSVTETWTAPVETVAKSEKGLERTIQGESTTLLFPARLGAASLRIRRL